MAVRKQMTYGAKAYQKRKAEGIVMVSIRMTKEEKAELDESVRLSGQPQNAFISEAIYTKIQDQKREIT